MVPLQGCVKSMHCISMRSFKFYISLQWHQILLSCFSLKSSGFDVELNESPQSISPTKVTIYFKLSPSHVNINLTNLHHIPLL